jgi:uncharacterized protein
MRKLIGGITAGVMAVALFVGVAAAVNGPMGFDPIAGSAYGQESSTWDEPFVVPEGFTQTLVKDETTFDIYPGVDDLTDMNTVNENGIRAGRYLYRTHEVGSNGSVSVVDLQTGGAEVIAQDLQAPTYRRLDGLRWTPWGTVLFAEEVTGGRLFELFLDPADPTEAVKVETRTEVGILRHEGIEALGNGTVFVVDELNGGSIYKFVPTKRGDLSDGQLYALKITRLSDAAQKWDPATFGEKVGAFEWVALDMNQVVVDADAASNAVNATEFGRPEDIEVIGSVLYVANTTEDRVIAIDLANQVVSSYVLAGENVPVEDQDEEVTGFNNPDNLAQGPDGRLWIVEDNDFSDIWVAEPDQDEKGIADDVNLFASLKDVGAEGTGICFGKDPKTLFVNIQHPDKVLADGTWKISKG